MCSLQPYPRILQAPSPNREGTQVHCSPGGICHRSSRISDSSILWSQSFSNENGSPAARVSSLPRSPAHRAQGLPQASGCAARNHVCSPWTRTGDALCGTTPCSRSQAGGRSLTQRRGSALRRCPCAPADGSRGLHSFGMGHNIAGVPLSAIRRGAAFTRSSH